MLRRIDHIGPASLAVLATCALAIGSIQAGGYHNVETQNNCSDCHTSHASVRSQTNTPSQHLLKSSSGKVGLCMNCHDGTDPKAPDIVAAGSSASPADVVATQYTSQYGASAGVFQSDYLMAPNPHGHDLSPAASVTVPLSNGARKIGGLMCSDCHDPHGNGNYRNLLPDPNPNNPGSYSIVVGTQVRETTPTDAQAPNPAVTYDTDNISFNVQNNIGGWCADCHTQLGTNATGSAPAHFRGHPSDVAIGGIGSHTDSSNWTSPSGQGNTGFGTAVDDTSAGIPRVRFGSPSTSNTIAGAGDTVTCLSCHKAHGSKNKHAMVWPLHKAGADTLSGCQQCHYK